MNKSSQSNTPEVVMMLAGRSRRMGEITKDKPKSLLEFLNKPLLGHFMDRLIAAGLKNITIIVGYRGDQIKQFLNSEYEADINLTVIQNDKYLETNNLYSLSLAGSKVAGQPFLLCNGDIMVNQKIIEAIVLNPDRSAIALDDQHKHQDIDSPGTIIKNNRILDLGRHISNQDNGGYAIGLYYFNAELSKAFFKAADTMLADNLDAGFHDPLAQIFQDNPVMIQSTMGLSWTDVDKPDEMENMTSTIKQIIKEESR
jgi:L-glutamine-phosphate cytidylyltransferase